MLSIAYICYRKLSYIVLTILGSFLLYLVASQFVLGVKTYIKWQVMEQLQIITSNSSTGPMEAPLNAFNVSSVITHSTRSNNLEKSAFTSYCPETSPLLVGRINVSNESINSLEELELAFKKSNLFQQPGGIYKPVGCMANHRVAIIIPFRNREKHLLLFLQHMHPFLQRQQIEYGIFVVEQSGTAPFNRAALMNIGAIEALNQTSPPFQCFIFHDVDLLPEDDHNIYNCFDNKPRHMSVAVDTMDYILPYESIFGGVTAMTKDNFFSVNGFSNVFWGWGGEDDDMQYRIQHHNLSIFRSSAEIARYTMVSHKKASPNPERMNILDTRSTRFSTDGLNSLKYKRLDLQFKMLYTHIIVDLLYTVQSKP